MNFQKIGKNIFFAAMLFFVVFVGQSAKAADDIGNYTNFTVEERFEKNEKSQVSAVLVKTTANLYFYIDKSWWEAQVLGKQNEILANLDVLSNEFSNNIYPTLTSVFGQERKPGVDGGNRITILFHLMKEGAGGYFRSADEYINLQVPGSNEREMLYLPILDIDSSKAKIFLAHEFVHLITFNQKDMIHNVQEEVWLNEARADYSSTILGYDSFYEGSNLQRRVKDFLNSPSDSVIEWQESKYDYASISLFMHYLTDHYGINILSDSLKSELVGIASINKILLENGYKEDFKQIFTNWTVATLINDCSLDQKYCYLNSNLKNIRLNPTLNFLPLSGSSSLSVTNVTKNWSGNWQKIIGGNGNLKLTFTSLTGLSFQVPYILYEKTGAYTVNFLKLDAKQKGEIVVQDFGTKYNSLIIIPSLQTKMLGFDGAELTYPYTFTVSINQNTSQEDTVTIQKLLDQIEELKKQIADILAQGNPGGVSCVALNSNLYIGLSNNDVRCLQQFLISQGVDIYPEALVTGYFGNFTKAATIRFQKKYGIPDTGFVGILTRAKINTLLNPS